MLCRLWRLESAWTLLSLLFVSLNGEDALRGALQRLNTSFSYCFVTCHTPTRDCGHFFPTLPSKITFVPLLCMSQVVPDQLCHSQTVFWFSSATGAVLSTQPTLKIVLLPTLTHWGSWGLCSHTIIIYYTSEKLLKPSVRIPRNTWACEVANPSAIWQLHAQG